MNKFLLCSVAVALAGLILSGCSSTTLTGSWSNPEYTGRLSNIYVVGVSRQETRRRIFEDAFGEQLLRYGMRSIPSYRDLPEAESADRKVIDAKVLANGADAVLLTRILDQRTEKVVTPGRISGYRTVPGYGYRGYAPLPHYYRYDSYYDRRYEMIYEPATVTRFKVLTLESNLYAAATGELIWSAQLESVVDGSMQKLIQDFVQTVTKDLRSKGLI